MAIGLGAGPTRHPGFWMTAVPAVDCRRPAHQDMWGPAAAPDACDVQQGRFRSCHLLAAAQAVVVRTPEVLSTVFAPSADGWDMRYFVAARDGRLRESTVAIPRQPPAFNQWGCKALRLSAQNAHPATPLWPGCLENAYAATHGGYRAIARQSAYPGDSLAWFAGCEIQVKGYGRSLKQMGAQLLHLSGGLPRIPQRQRMTDAAVLYEAGECVIVHTRTHAYAVVRVQRRDGEIELTLLNPVAKRRRQVVLRTWDWVQPLRIVSLTGSKGWPEHAQRLLAARRTPSVRQRS